MDQSIWFVETQFPDDWRWYRLNYADTRSAARLIRDGHKVMFPGKPYRVKQYKRVDE